MTADAEPLSRLTLDGLVIANHIQKQADCFKRQTLPHTRKHTGLHSCFTVSAAGDNKHKCVRLLTHCENSSVIALSFLSVDERIADQKKTVSLLLQILSDHSFERS